jgi:hypothetical protein
MVSGIITGTDQSYQVRVPAHAASTSTERVVLVYASFAMRIKAVRHVPDTIVTGANTNTTHLNLIDAGASGAGTTEMGNIDYVNGTDTPAEDARAFTTSGSTFTAFTLDAGDVFSLQYEKVSNGLAIPAGMIVIEFEPR